MDHQKWFEKYKTKLRFHEERSFLRPLEYLEDWKLIRITVIRIAIALLPAPDKHIVRYIFLKGMTEIEVARKLRIPRLKVHRRKWRAIKKLFESPVMKFVLPPDQFD